VTVNAAQAAWQRENATYVPLSETPGIDRAPFGFLPRLVFDRWGYLISLKDFFDPCGFTLFSDERGVIYESHPSAINRATQPTTETTAPTTSGTIG
jgi:hypothetical protein